MPSPNRPHPEQRHGAAEARVEGRSKVMPPYSDTRQIRAMREREDVSAGAGVALADEAQMVAEIGPQLARPFRVGGAFPCRRGLHLG